jgi:NAD(P)-dependent dehydrogenase (short-subunit alcohol dehydrogenase family)
MPRVLVVGGNGTIGKAVVAALRHEGAEVLIGGRGAGGAVDVTIDIDDTESIRAALAKFDNDDNRLDHIVVLGGSAIFKPVGYAKREELVSAFNSKCLGQLDVAAQAPKFLRAGGTITLTSGVLSDHYVPAGVFVSAINAAVDAFVRSAAFELGNGVKINSVSPGLITESEPIYGPYFKGIAGVDAAVVAKAYVRSVYGGITGKVLRVASAPGIIEL